MSDGIDLTPWENHDGPPPDFDSPVYPVFDSGVTWAIGQLAVVLNIDCNDFSWDAATEEYDGDVRAVIGNAITAALGEEWSDFRAQNARLREALRKIATGEVPTQSAFWQWHDRYQDQRDFARAALETKGARNG